ncbi:MAG: hypothetical protein HY647_08240 [Acidobacteria bacterium]|nr:hypothetical protein [Acidobacteriota bacterium]
MEPPKKETFAGKLERVFAIGGETTGWALALSSEREIGDRKVRSVELDPAPHGVRLDPLEGKRVEATGVLQWREGVERKRYVVLVVETIREQDGTGGRSHP